MLDHMCALYTLKTTLKQITDKLRHLSPLTTNSPEQLEYRPQGYLKTNQAPVIFMNDSGNLEMKEMCFSLCPSWSKEFPTKFTTYNARMERPSKIEGQIERIYDVATWKESFRNGKTCLVPMNTATESSYFGESAGNIVGFSKTDDEVFFVAGLYNEWLNKETGEVVDTFTLITDDPYEFFFRHGHDRSVFVIDDKAHIKWLTDKKMKHLERFNLLRENRINLDWKVETERPLAKGWEKRAPSPEEIEAMKVWVG